MTDKNRLEAQDLENKKDVLGSANPNSTLNDTNLRISHIFEKYKDLSWGALDGYGLVINEMERVNNLLEFIHNHLSSCAGQCEDFETTVYKNWDFITFNESYLSLCELIQDKLYDLIELHNVKYDELSEINKVILELKSN